MGCFENLVINYKKINQTKLQKGEGVAFKNSPETRLQKTL